MTTLFALDQVDISGQWAGFWSTLSSTLGTGPINFLRLVGLVLFLVAIGTFVNERRRSGGGGGGGGGGRNGASKFLWVGIMALILGWPNVFFPPALTLIDAILNVLVAAWNKI